MSSKLKTFSVLIACTVSAYKTVTVRAKSVEDAESRVTRSLTKDGFASPHATDNTWEEDWQQADDLRVVEDSVEDVTP